MSRLSRYPFSYPLVVTGVFTLLLSQWNAAQAQLPNSELHAITPPIIPAGQSVEISLTGTNLDELTGLHFSDPRIKAEPVMLPASEFKKYPVQNGTKFKVTVPGDLAPAIVEVRATGYFGLSTSRPLHIAGKEAKLLADAGAGHHQKETAPALPLETQAYGITDASQIDYWKFSAKKGQRLLIHCRAERIDSKADATLKVVDGRGFELEHNRDAIGRDPMIDFTAPADGDYWVGVHDFLYGGGATYPYLLTISARPWIDAVFPPAGQPGQVIEATLIGRNLPGGSPGEGLSIDGKPIETATVRITVPKEPGPTSFEWTRPSHALLPGFSFQHQNSNAVEIGFAGSPVIAVPNDADIPPVTPPTEIAACFDTAGDSDVFRFVAKKGTVYWIEAIGDRLSGKIDPYLIVEKITRAADGTETFAKVRDGDDEAGNGGATFDAGSRDSALTITADQDGEYRVTVVNQFASGGPEKLYRLAIREARPDFELTAVTERPYLEANQTYPAAPLIRQGGTTLIRVLVQRQDGFDGPVTLKAESLPAGVTCPPVTVAGKENTASLVFQASPDAAAWSGGIKITGSSKIGDAEVSRPARAGSLVWGTADRTKDRLRARLDLGIPLAISPSEKTPIAIEAPAPLTVEMGQKLEIPVKVSARNGVKGNLAVSVLGLHGLTKSPIINIAEKDAEGKLTLDFKAVKNVFAPEPGTWTFVLKGTGVTKYQHNPKALERATEEQKLTDELVKKYTDAAAAAKTGVDVAKKALDQANQNLATASGDAKAQAAKTAAEAKTRFEAAQKTATDADAKKAAADKAKVAAAAVVKAVTAKAKEKDVKFAAYSLPVTVVVKPTPEPEKK